MAQLSNDLQERSPAEGLSLIIPVYNEEESLAPLYAECREVLGSLGRPYEILFVDDGSQDGTPAFLERVAGENSRVKVIRFSRNFGQTSAMAAGIAHARMPLIAFLDGDGQNDPHDLPLLLAKVEEGHDLVSGWRKHRQDPFLSRRLPSTLANGLISRLSGLPLRDYGCTLKIYRRHILERINLYGEMHRFIPILARWAGARVVEVPVRHRPRRHGTSKYGLGRVFKVLLDLVTIKFLTDYSTKPIYLFGALGFTACAGGTLAGAITLLQKFLLEDAPVHRNPLILLAVFLFTLGVQFIMMGVLAELMIRTYHEAQRKPIYTIDRTVNLEENPQAPPAAAPGPGPDPARPRS